MILSDSFQRKVVATCGAALGFWLLYEARAFDSREAERLTAEREAQARPAPGLRLRFSATAYCKGETTAAGTAARTGVAAADPTLLPVGSVVRIDSLGPRYNGIYTVMDTGPSVRGREIDLYMWSCHEALEFGRRPARVTVLRLGWSPTASAPGAVDRLFLERERERDAEGPPAASAASPAAPTPTPSPSRP